MYYVWPRPETLWDNLKLWTYSKQVFWESGSFSNVAWGRQGEKLNWHNLNRWSENRHLHSSEWSVVVWSHGVVYVNWWSLSPDNGRVMLTDQTDVDGECCNRLSTATDSGCCPWCWTSHCSCWQRVLSFCKYDIFSKVTKKSGRRNSNFTS